MSWKFAEVVTSRQTVKCAACESAMAPDEAKIRVNPVAKHQGQVFHYYHTTCFAGAITKSLEEIVASGSWAHLMSTG